MNDFKVGDRVEVVDGESYIYTRAGSVGVIIEDGEKAVRVKFSVVTGGNFRPDTFANILTKTIKLKPYTKLEKALL